jgi:hypothetical protein
MYHTIEFTQKFMVDLEVSPKQPLERVCVRKGVRRQAQVRPYVMDTEAGLVEVADLYFDDGTATRLIPFACFRFAE